MRKTDTEDTQKQATRTLYVNYMLTLLEGVYRQKKFDRFNQLVWFEKESVCVRIGELSVSHQLYMVYVLSN